MPRRVNTLNDDEIKEQVENLEKPEENVENTETIAENKENLIENSLKNNQENEVEPVLTDDIQKDNLSNEENKSTTEEPVNTNFRYRRQS